MDKKRRNGQRRRAKNPKLAGTYDIPHVAQVLNIGINAAYRAAKAGQIPGVIVVGSRVLVVKRIFDRAMGEAA